LSFLEAASSGGGNVVGDILVIAFYFIPTIVAISRKVPNAGSVFLINLLLGWTVIGWVVALVKAVKSKRSQFQAPEALPRCATCDSRLTPGQQFCFCGAPRSTST